MALLYEQAAERIREELAKEGRVYALDVSPEMLQRLRERSPPPQVELVPSEESRLPLLDRSVRLALLAFVLHVAPRSARFPAPPTPTALGTGRGCVWLCTI